MSFFIIAIVLLLNEPGQLIWSSDEQCARRAGFHSQQEQEICLFSTVSRLLLGATQPPIQREQVTLSLGVKWSLREAKHLYHPMPRARMVELYLQSSIRLHIVALKYLDKATAS
jgi:hypothetical protein